MFARMTSSRGKRRDDALRRGIKKKTEAPRKAAAQTNAERQCQHCADPPPAATAYRLSPPPRFNMLTLRWIGEKENAGDRIEEKEP